jgi:peptidoglycan hydrolase-like protein with peptidoglycan-binding domain
MAARHAVKSPHRGRRRALLLGGVAVVAAGAVAVSVALVPTSAASPQAGAATHGPLRVLSITPHSAWTSPDTPLRVLFNNPIAANSPMPTITPAVAGAWVRLSPDAISFRAAATLTPGRSYRVVVPATTRSTGSMKLGTAVARRFTVAYGSTLRLQQILAQLGYLPVRFVPTGQFSPASSAVQRGAFAWRWATVPKGLTSLWQPGVFDVITKGALMRFEDANGLPTLETPNPAAWAALLTAVANGKINHDSYNYVDVTTAIPQTLTLYVNMKPIYTALVNTGISSRPTLVETDPVYLRFTTTTMSGTNPDGSTYHDAGIPWVSYFKGGEALHGFIRGSYGWPQSLGCIEMPFDNAKSVFPYTPIGTLVTIR